MIIETLNVNAALFGGVTFVQALLEDNARPIALRNQIERMSGLVKKLLNLHKLKTKPYVGKSRIIDLSGSSKT